MRAIFIDSFVDGSYTVKSASGRQTAVFEDSNIFGPSFVNMRTGDVSPIPERHWFWKFYQPWRQAGRPTSGEPMSTPCGPLQRAIWATEDGSQPPPTSDGEGISEGDMPTELKDPTPPAEGE